MLSSVEDEHVTTTLLSALLKKSVAKFYVQHSTLSTVKLHLAQLLCL